MTVKGGKHQLTGVVSLGNFYNSMKKIESRRWTIRKLSYGQVIMQCVHAYYKKKII